jgi:tetratricopeptide (TPR) repeat protein
MSQRTTDRKELLSHARKAAKDKRFDEAARLLEELIERDGDDLDALDMLGFVRYFQGEFEQSRQCCEKALAIHPEHAYAHKGLGLNLARLGQLEQGLAHLGRAMELKPSWPDPVHDCAVVLFEAGQGEKAIELIDDRTALYPDLAQSLAWLRAQLKKKVR